MESRWQSDCEDEDVTTEKANLVLQQAKDRLESTIDHSDSLDNKTIVLLPVLITLITALLGFITTQYDPKLKFISQHWFVLGPMIILVTFFCIAAWQLSSNLKPMDYEPAGKTPKNLAKKQLLKLSDALMIFCEAESYQPRIEKNDAANEVKASRISDCLKTVKWGFLATMITYLVFIYLYS